jgi:two-component system sensor histidine kinase PhcS
VAAIPQKYLARYEDYDREVTLRKTRLGTAIGIVLVPLFWFLDSYVYPEHSMAFLQARLLCSLLMALLYPLLGTGFGQTHYRFLGLLILFMPSATIAWMVYLTGGADSPYYAGLILVVTVVAVVLDWSFWQSVASVLLVLLLYLIACWSSLRTASFADLVNNLFFLTSIGIVSNIGAYFHSNLRKSEFVSRCELDKSRHSLQASNLKLDSQNRELADTIEKLTEAESRLVQKEKMASLGVMSAGIIHEINNPLNYATTGLFALRNKAKSLAPQEQTEYAEVLKDVEEGIKRVKDIVSDLRMFTHPNTGQIDQVDVDEVVASALRFLSNEWRDKVRVEQNLPATQTIWANKSKLIHLCTNLLQNSLDALKRKSFVGEQPTIWIEGRVEDGRSFLVIRDNGGGVDPEHLDKIFDPFFTTKDVGEGMGLGLSICYRIVQDCDGRITVKSESGKFCEFTLEFPVKGGR